MNSFLFLVSVFLLSNLSVSCVYLFSSATDKRIRRALLASLSRFQGKEAPLTASGLNSFESAPSQGMNFASRNFPFDLKQKIFEYSDFKHLSITAQVNRSVKNEVKISTERRLSRFHPHFATEDPLVNNLLYIVLNEHFRCVKNANDPLIHDHLQLLCAKYFYEDLDFSVIPSNIYYYIICFMFEMIYETDMKTPATKFEFLNDFVCSLRVAEHSLEKSYSYVFSKFLLESENGISFGEAADAHTRLLDYSDCFSLIMASNMIRFPNSCEYLDFFYSKPTIEEIESKFSSYWIDLEHEMDMHPSFVVAILESILPIIPETELSRVLSVTESSIVFSHYSSVLVDRIVRARDEMPLDMRRSRNIKYDEVLSLANETNFYFKFKFYNLSHLDNFSYFLANASENEISSVQDYFRDNISNSFFTELIIKESFKSINLYGNIIIELSTCVISFARLFLRGLPSDDPFILLFFSVEVLKRVQDLIQDKFDLNKFYTLNAELDFDFKESDLGYNMRKARSFSFKDAVRSFGNGNDEEVMSIFTSNTDEFKDFQSIKSNEPIVVPNISERSNSNAIHSFELSRTMPRDREISYMTNIFRDTFFISVIMIILIIHRHK
jgi:hypothetical protein